MWDKYPSYFPMYNFPLTGARVEHYPSALSSQFLPVSGILHDIHPHLTCTSTGMCQEKEKDVRDSGYGFKPGSPRTQHPISAPVVAPGPKLSTSRPTSLSVRACLFVGSTRPLLSVIRRDSSDCMLVVLSLNDHVHAS